MNGDFPRKDLRMFFIVLAVLTVFGLAAAGFMLGHTQQQVSLTSTATARASSSVAKVLPTTKPAPTPTSQPSRTLAPAPTEAPMPEPSSTAAMAPDVPALATSVPDRPVPVVPQPASTCPPDNGVTLSIESARMMSEGSSADTFELTLTLDNQQSVPVNLSTIDLIYVRIVRADGAETGAGSIVLPMSHSYEVQPGKSSLTLDTSDRVIAYHGYGSPIVAFELSGEVGVENTVADMYKRSKYCSFSHVQMGAPLQGHWGS